MISVSNGQTSNKGGQNRKNYTSSKGWQKYQSNRTLSARFRIEPNRSIQFFESNRNANRNIFLKTISGFSRILKWLNYFRCKIFLLSLNRQNYTLYSNR